MRTDSGHQYWVWCVRRSPSRKFRSRCAPPVSQLNPYEKKGSIFKIEDTNYPIAEFADGSKFEPLTGLKDGKRIADAPLMKLFRAAEALRQETDPKAAAMDKALKNLRRLKEKVGGRNKLAKLLGVTGPYIGRVLNGEKPMTEGLLEKLNEAPDASLAS